MNILIVYYSETGGTASIAQAIAHGAKDRGATVRLRRVPELLAVTEQPTLSKPGRSAASKNIPYVRSEDVTWADGIAIGSPIRNGAISPQIQAFFLTLEDFSRKGALGNKSATIFTSAAPEGMAAESTLPLAIPLFSLGMTIVSMMPSEQRKKIAVDEDRSNYGYGELGRSWTPSSEAQPGDYDLGLARATGQRLAEIADRLRMASKTAA